MSSIYYMVCPNCNSDLQIGHDIKTFFCMNCGNEFTVEQHGGIIYLKLHHETKVDTAKQITNELNTKSITSGPTSPVKINSLQEQAYRLEEAQRQATKPNLMAVETKVAELYEQKKSLKESGRKFLNFYIIIGLIYLAITYAIQPVVSSVNELLGNLAIYWVPVVIMLFTLYISAKNRINQNQKFIDSYINKLKAPQENTNQN